MMQAQFKKLSQVDVSERIEKKNNLSYLSWSWAWAEACKNSEDIQYEIKWFDGKPYLYDDGVGYMVFTSVTMNGVTHSMWLPVMDGANKAMMKKPYSYKTRYGEKWVDRATMTDINKTIMRCLTKNLAMFGLGLYIYSGEDLPETLPPENEELPAPKKKTSQKERKAPSKPKSKPSPKSKPVAKQPTPPVSKPKPPQQDKPKEKVKDSGKADPKDLLEFTNIITEGDPVWSKDLLQKYTDLLEDAGYLTDKQASAMRKKVTSALSESMRDFIGLQLFLFSEIGRMQGKKILKVDAARDLKKRVFLATAEELRNVRESISKLD